MDKALNEWNSWSIVYSVHDCHCKVCGVSAKYYGTGSEVNKLAREFYEIHNHERKSDLLTVKKRSGTINS